MDQEFEINDTIMYRISNKWQPGVITTIFTNTIPIKYVVKNESNEKIYVNAEQLQQTTYDLNFQRILSQLIMQKNEDQLINELQQLLNKITPRDAIKENGPKIIYTTYQFLVMRKPSIIRNYPFASTNAVIKQLKTLICKIRKEVLKDCNLMKQQKKQQKLTKKQTSFWEDSEKEEQPTAFYENLSTNILVQNQSAFRPYKSIREESHCSTNTKPTPNTEQIKNIYFKPIIIQGPTIQSLLC